MPSSVPAVSCREIGYFDVAEEERAHRVENDRDREHVKRRVEVSPLERARDVLVGDLAEAGGQPAAANQWIEP